MAGTPLRWNILYRSKVGFWGYGYQHIVVCPFIANHRVAEFETVFCCLIFLASFWRFLLLPPIAQKKKKTKQNKKKQKKKNAKYKRSTASLYHFFYMKLTFSWPLENLMRI